LRCTGFYNCSWVVQANLIKDLIKDRAVIRSCFLCLFCHSIANRSLYVNKRNSLVLFFPIALVAKKARIKLSGVLPYPTNMAVDIVITLYDKYGDATEVLNKCCVHVNKGVQFADSQITGIIQESKR
jgi:hypothetical protein